MSIDRFFLRVTMESRAPLIIASGDSDALIDTDPVRDANGVPMLPATSLAGALRAAAGDKAKVWFGWQERDKGQRSAVTLTDGLFHWSNNQPRDGLVLPPQLPPADDPLCRAVLPGQRPLTRQHVRLNEHGVADGTGKFSRDAVPSGARFTFEITTDQRHAWEGLQRILAGGLFLGGANRAGYGEMVCIALRGEALSLPKDWERLKTIRTGDLGSHRGMPIIARAPQPGLARVWTVKGQIEGPLLIGADGRNDKEDRAPWSEPWIDWSKGTLAEEDRFVVPGSAIKGSVRHRVLFHLGDPAQVDALFGVAASDQGGAAGHLRFHDCQIEGTTEITQTHVGLDRFTGGPRRSVLFTDAMLWRPKLTIRISEVGTLTEKQRDALRKALNDLAGGCLGLGAEWGEGAGVLIGTVHQPEEARDES